jgi:lysophospholipase L1-like esterase
MRRRFLGCTWIGFVILLGMEAGAQEAQQAQRGWAQEEAQISREIDAIGKNQVLALGDSLTYIMAGVTDDFPGLPDARLINAGFIGMRTGELLLRTQALLDRAHPWAVLLMVGTNDRAQVGRNGTAAWLRDYSAIVRLIERSGVVPILETVPPTARHGGFVGGAAGAMGISAMNRAIRLLCQKDPHAVLVDLDPVLKGPDGFLPPGATDDGVHMDVAEYAKMAPLQRAGVQRAEGMRLPRPGQVHSDSAGATGRQAKE